MLHVTMVLARDRKSGETSVLFLQASLSGGTSSAEYSDLHERVRAANEEGAAMRAKYSNVLFFIDNGLASSYELPDPSKLARDAELSRLDQARRDLKRAEEEHTRATTAAAQASVAKSSADLLRSEISELEKKLGVPHEDKAAPGVRTQSPARAIVVPNLKELMAATGYAERICKRIIAGDQAKADALAANPLISETDLTEAERKALEQFDIENPPPSLIAVYGSPNAAAPRTVIVPTLQDLIQQGNDERAAKRIIAVEQAKADALQDNPQMPDEDLLAVGQLAGEQFDSENPVPSQPPEGMHASTSTDKK